MASLHDTHVCAPNFFLQRHSPTMTGYLEQLCTTFRQNLLTQVKSGLRQSKNDNSLCRSLSYPDGQLSHMYRLIEQRVFYTDSHQAYRKSLRDAQKSMNTLPPSLATDEGVDSLEMYERHHSKELLQECWDWAESLLDTLKECNRAGRELERRRKELVKSGILKERPFIGLDEKISNPFVFETILRYDRDSNGVGAPPTSSIQSSKPEDGPSAVESTRRHTASF